MKKQGYLNMRLGISSDLIVRILGGTPQYTIAALQEKYPARKLTEGAMITRFAPSPTGYMHIGGLYQALIDYKLARQSDGVFMLRIEDTDTKRGMQDAVHVIMDAMKQFGLEYNNSSEYGPYYQSERKDIYLSVAAELLACGAAYPCFLTSQETDDIRDKQKSAGLPTGIYGEFAHNRDLTDEQIKSYLDEEKKPSIRLYSNGNPDIRIFCKDIVRGSISFPENNEDTIIIKSNDGLPTYHFAHLIDDHVMRTTHVVRGEEWLSSFPLHIQMFKMIGWTPPLYIHTSTIDKIDTDTGKQRKLSKRHDPEANVAFFLSDGWPIEAVLEYLFNIAAPGYEEAKGKGQVKNIWEYNLHPKKIPISGALFDMKKLEWWSREFIGTLPVDNLVNRVITWAREYDTSWLNRIAGAEDYLASVLAIERDNPKHIRKDFITWRQTLDEVSYFWDNLFITNSEFEYNKNVLDTFIQGFDITDSKDIWWNKITEIANNMGIKNGGIAMNLRVALTGRNNTPDLYSVMQVMGDNMVRARIAMVA